MKTSLSLCTLLFTVAFFCVSVPHIAQAGHAAGASITYAHLNGNMYRLQVAFYRDCSGIPAPVSISVIAESATCGIMNSYTLLPLPGTGTGITLLCNGVLSTCDGGNEPGYEKWEYGLDIQIPAMCPDWFFTVNIPGRNGGTTIQNSSDLIVRSHLNNSISDNSSPRFLNDPVMFACMNQYFHFNNGVTDPDGDSLVYHLVDAVGAIYVPGHSGQQPFISVPPVTYDSITGDLVMFPIANESGPIVYEIQDYRSGLLMGSVSLEITTRMPLCQNQIPVATGINGTAQQFTYVLPGDTVCFDILSDDLDAANMLTMTWNGAIPSATFTTTGSPYPTGTFCWVPSPADVRSQPYQFTAMIRDDNCPGNGAGVYSYLIYVTLDSSLVFLNTEQMQLRDEFVIYPNPSDGIISFHSSENVTVVTLFNQLGIFRKEVPFQKTFSLAGLPQGIYFVEAVTESGSIYRKKIVRK